MFPGVNWVSSSPVTGLTALLINHGGEQALEEEWKGEAIHSKRSKQSRGQQYHSPPGSTAGASTGTGGGCASLKLPELNYSTA